MIKKISLLSKLKNNPELIGDPKQVNKKLGNIISKLDDIKEIDIISRIKEEYDSHTKSLETEKCLRFLTVGGYSSGKSTLLNTVIIGQDILTVSAKECTRTGLIIKHSEKDIGLYYVDFVTKDNDYYFDYNDKSPIATDINKIKEIIKELNNQPIFENNNIPFFLLKIPLKFFEYIEDDSLKDKIEFIDYPGLDTDFQLPNNDNLVDNKNEKENLAKVNLDNNTKALLQYTNGFIFVNDGIQVLEHGNKVLLERVLDNIRKRQSNFSFKSCIFILNKCDTAEIDIKKSRDDFIRLINNIQKCSEDGTYLKRMYNTNELRSEDDMNVSKFSSNLFNEYLSLFKNTCQKYLNQYFDSKKDIDDIIDTLTKEFKKKYGKKKVKIEFKDIKINNFRISNEILKECDIKNINMEKYQSKIKKISKLYLYIKELSKLFNKYESSNAEHFFESLSKVIKESNKFYTYDLQKSEIQYFIKLNHKLSEILKSINKKSGKINPDDYTKEKEEKSLNDVINIFEEFSTRINIITQNLKQTINNNITKMLENKNKNAKEFNLFVIDIAKENQNILENNKNEIKIIFIELIKTLQEYIKRIKGLSEEKSNQFYMEDFNLSLTTDIKEANPVFIEKIIDSLFQYLYFKNTFLNNIVNKILGLFIDHSKEHEKFIREYQNNITGSLSIYLEKIERILKNYEHYYCEEVKNIFLINGKDLKKIKKNKTIFEDVNQEFEDFLSSIVEEIE